MYSNNEYSRMSQIADHNINIRTDNLYEPLRNALRKSTVSSNFLAPQNKFADNRLSVSRVAKNVRSLSPAETEIIKKSIFIPIDKELVPTRNLQKVMGKQFITVDMEQKVGEAISPDEFSRVKTGTIQEIVYQIKDDEPPHSIYTNTVKNRPQQVSSPIPFYQYRPSQPQLLPPPVSKVYTSQVQAPLSMQPSYTTRTNLPSQRINETTRSPQNLSQGLNLNNFFGPSNGSNKVLPNTYQNTALQTVKSQQFIRDQMLPNSTRSVLQNRQPSEKSGQTENMTVRAYDFRQSTASKQDSIMRLRKQREEYKYNLFSLIDEGGNNGCKNGCFGSNEICAPKISTNPWK